MEPKIEISQATGKLALQALGELPIRVALNAFQEIFNAIQAVNAGSTISAGLAVSPQKDPSP